MPKAKFSKSNLEIEGQEKKRKKIFKDRIEVRKSFWDSYSDIENDLENFKVMQFNGLGGIGKTTLIEKLSEELDEKKLDYISFDFEHYSPNDKILILRDIGSKLFKLDKNRFKFYRFRIALSRYADETEQELEIKNDNSSFLTKNAIADLCMELGTNIPDIINEIPILGKVLSGIKLADKTREVIKSQIDTQYMKKTFEEIKALSVNELVDAMPKLFAEDLAESMLKSKAPLVIFIDTYEKIAESNCNDSWFKSIMDIPQGILWAIAGRDEIDFPKSFEAESFQIGNLSYEDSKEYFEEYEIKKELIDDLYKLTEGLPVYLDICVETYNRLVALGNDPKIEDFGDTKEKLLERYAKYMSKTDKEIAYFLSYIDSWSNEEIYDFIKQENIISFSVLEYKNFINHSFIVEKDGLYYMNKVVNEVFYKDIPLELFKEYNEIVFNYFDKKLKDETDPLYTEYFIDYYYEFLTKTRISTDWVEDYFELSDRIDVLARKGYFGDAIEYSMRLVDHFEKLPGNDRFKKMIILKAKHDLAHAYMFYDSADPAIILLQEVLEGRKKLLGEENQDTIGAEMDLAICYDIKSEYDKALEIRKRILPTAVKIFGEDGENTLNIIMSIATSNIESLESAMINGNVEKIEERIRLLEDALKKAQKRYGKKSDISMKIIDDLSMLFELNEEYEKAFKYQYEHLSYLLETLDEDDLPILHAKCKLAGTLLNLERYDEAKGLYEEVLEGYKRIYGENHLYTKNVQESLDELNSEN